jgi:ParB family chromosome partitioning protein
MSPGLGRGLGALIPPTSGGSVVSKREKKVVEALTEKGAFRECPISKIVANPEQPRRHFDHAALEDLVASIKEHGIVEPLIVTEKKDGTYELIAGERRLRAATIAGLATVPCVVRTATDQEKLELAIIENVQRHDLNAIEEAHAYDRLVNEFGLTQEAVAKRVGKSRSQVANTIRLLQLPEDIRQAVTDGKISASNARTLLALESVEERNRLFRDMQEGGFTVRQAEARVAHPRSRSKTYDPNIAALEDDLRSALRHRVRINLSGSGKGDIRISFENGEDLQDLTDKLRS